MGDRRRFLLTSLAGALAAPLSAGAQQAGRIYRIGYLSGISPIAPAPSAESLRQGLRELGWLEGQNFIIDYRHPEGRFDRLPDLMAELVWLKVDVIVAGATPVAVAAKNGTGTIPIVMFGVGDPGLVQSLARPGGNVTGLAFSVGLDTFGKGLALLKEARRPSSSCQTACSFSTARASPTWREGTACHRCLGSGKMYAGGLMSYGPSTAVALRRAAVFVDKILRGARPADLPVEQPTEFEPVINLKTAKALGLTIPPPLLARADHVIE